MARRLSRGRLSAEGADMGAGTSDGSRDTAWSQDAATPSDVGDGFGVAPFPANETARLRTLHGYGILDTGRDARFEVLAEEVARVCATPVATITFVDEARQWFKAAVGLSIEQTDRDIAFCSHTILEPDRTLVVEDTTRDARFSTNPLVLGDPHLMAYAGAPMVAPDGTVIGTVCAMDYEPRSYTPQQLAALQRIASRVVELLDATGSVDGPVADSETSLHRSSARGAISGGGQDLAGEEAGGGDGREGSADEVLELTRPLIEAIGEEVDVSRVMERFCADVLETFGWWAARIGWVQGDVLRQGAWMLGAATPPALNPLAGSMAGPMPLEDLILAYRELAVQDIGMLRWIPDRDVVAGVGGRHAVVLDVPGSSSLAARITFLLPSARALGLGAVRTLTTASAVLPRVITQDRARRELTYRATHDMLTGLLNREGLASRYSGVVSGGTTSRAVLHIDVDDFKAVNDGQGHRVGDEVLAVVARQLSGRIRPTDTATRLGGDEFLVVLDGILHEDEALQVARRLLRALCGSFTVSHSARVDIAVSVGLAMWSEGMDLTAAVEAADRLMYAAKELGGAAVAVDTHEGRRLLGVSDGDDRDLDAVLSGAIQVAVAPVRDGDGGLHGVRVELTAEVRHPSVDSMVGLVVRSVQPLLEGREGSDAFQLTLVPSPMLWSIDGLVLRLLAGITAGLRGVSLRLLLMSGSATEESISQALMVRDALGAGLVVGGFGSPAGDLGLVDRVAPVALEFAPQVLIVTSEDAPASAAVAARALAAQYELELIVPILAGPVRPDGQGRGAPALRDLLEQGGARVRYADIASSQVQRHEPPQFGSDHAPDRRRRREG